MRELIPDLPTVIDDTELVAIADAMYEAMNSDDVDSVLTFMQTKLYGVFQMV